MVEEKELATHAAYRTHSEHLIAVCGDSAWLPGQRWMSHQAVHRAILLGFLGAVVFVGFLSSGRGIPTLLLSMRIGALPDAMIEPSTSGEVLQPVFHANMSAKEAFEFAAGVYHSATLRERYKTDRTVLVTTANSSMRAFLENWMCHANRPGYKYLVHCLDDELYRGLAARGIPSLLINTTIPEFSGWGSNNYRKLTNSKTDILYLALELGYDAFYSDIDIGFVNDPFPMFRRDSNIEAQTGHMERDGRGMRQLNTGFLPAKSNNGTRVFYEALRKMNDTEQTQQMRFGVLARKLRVGIRQHNERKTKESNFRLLDPLKIVVGNSVNNERGLYLEALYANNLSVSDIGIIHANFVKGKASKHRMLNETGLWL